MTTIKIISGAYGHVSNGVFRSRDKDSAPFEVDDNEAKRLAELGVAKIIGSKKTADKVAVRETNDMAEEENELSQADEVDPLEYSTETPAKELREIGKKCGLSFRVGITKEEMVKALDEYFGVAASEDGSDGDELHLTAEDPVQ